jgi:hypothetical protein
MRRIRSCLIAVIVFGVAGSAGAAGPMALTRAGDLYNAAVGHNQVVVTARYADGTVSDLVVPQSAFAVPDSLQVGVDENTGAVHVLWQRQTGMDARLRLASYIDGTWIGPTTFAGYDGTAAFNPQMLIDRVVTTITDEGEEGEDPTVEDVATTFLHLAWWSQAAKDDPGMAKYAAVRIDEQTGEPQFWDMTPIELVDLLPFGIVCFDLNAGDNLKHPKLFVDPQTGNPHIFATDIANCHFQILEAANEVEVVDKRRRQIIILRQAKMIALRPTLPLATGRLEVGNGLKLLMHWDGEDDTLNYVELDPEGISATKTLKLSSDLSHEQAVGLIRELAN